MPEPGRYVSVAPAVPLSASARQIFSYRLPPGVKLEAGSAVTIPFGKRRTAGVVMQVLTTRPKIPAKIAAPIADISLTPRQMQFAQWIAQTMRGGLGYTLRLFLPPQLSLRLPPVTLTSPAPKRKKTKSLKILASPEIGAVDDNAMRRRQQIKELVETILTASSGQVLIIVPEKHMLGDWQPYPFLHAALPARQQAALWHGVREGSLRAIAGTQKALFLPFQNLRLIVVDEEQLPTHKLWDQYPRLDNRDAARKLAALHRGSVVFSSSFPSLSLYRAIQHDHVPTLANHPPRLRLSVLPLTGSDRSQRNLLPLTFIDTLRGWLAKKHQTLLLLNRSGEEPKSLQHMLKNTFGSLTRYLTLATSAIFSGQERPEFSRVAWLFPEYTFTYPDFRSTEHGLITLARAAQLLPGNPITVITRNVLLAHQLEFLNWEQWYEILLAERKSLGLPPFHDAILLTIQGGKPRTLQRQALKTREILENRLRESGASSRLQGPFQSLAGTTRPDKREFHLLLLGELDQLSPLYQDLPVDRVDVSPSRIL